MLLDLQKILSALGLVSSIAKPLPLVGGVVGGLLDSAGAIANSTLGSSTGALNGIVPAGLIAAQNVTGNQTYLSAWTDPSLNSTATNSTLPSATVTSIPANATTAVSNATISAATGINATDPTISAADIPEQSCAVAPYTPAVTLLLESFADYDPAQALIYRYRQQQSVNLGSWFVQEQWMNPSLFTCASGNKQAELDVASGWGSVDNARQVLEKHWDEWITESDFQYLASIGSWSLGPIYCQGTVFEPVSAAYVNSWARVVRAINWAEKYGLGVLVDLHGKSLRMFVADSPGAPGSQNGQAHSGVSDGQQNLFNNPTNVQLTTNVLTYLTQQLVKVNNVVGIQILNEPSNVDGLPAFYTQMLATLRQVSPEANAFPFYINDAFDMNRFADYISTRSDFVVLDHHSCQCPSTGIPHHADDISSDFVFGDHASQELPASQLIDTLRPNQGSLSEQMISAASEERRNIVIDEFSCALSQDALSNSSDPVGDRRNFCTGQMESYSNATAGWSFWSYKTEACATDVNWCFTSAVGNSLPSSFWSYPNATIQAMAESDPTSPTDGSTDTSFLSFGTSSPTDGDSDYQPPSTDSWLAQIGDQNEEFDKINEALATTEYDFDGTDPAPVQAAYSVENTVPSSRMQSSKRSVGFGSLPQRAFLLSTNLQKHRFMARHLRAAARDDTTASQSQAIDYTPEQSAVSRGYADGWKAAKTFAAFNSSRLGFSGQFMNDAITALGAQVISGDETFYKTWFMKGLADGEVQIVKVMAMQAQGPQ
ncbi:hypothetical protein P7C73_g2316, partial [Tremellales sp. Uapishka_1]